MDSTSPSWKTIPAKRVKSLLLAPFLDKPLSMIDDKTLERALPTIGGNPSPPEDLCLTTAFAKVREAGDWEIKTDLFPCEHAAATKAAGVPTASWFQD